MNADILVPRVRDWLNSRIGHRHICVHRRSSAAKIPFFCITQPKPNAARQDPGSVHPHAAAKPGTTVPIKPSRIDPLNREPKANPATAPFKPSRIDPLNREPTAKPGSTVPFKPSRIDPLNREPTAKPAPTAPSAAGSNAFSIAETAQPARALHPIALSDPTTRPAKLRLLRRDSRSSLTA